VHRVALHRVREKQGPFVPWRGERLSVYFFFNAPPSNVETIACM
jgi:hypothetical protein